jgi:integrase/plasmid stability protein
MQEYRIGRLNGRFVVTWHDPAGKRRRFRLAAATARAADAEARDIIRAATLPAAGLTVAGIWADYAAECAGRPVAESLEYRGRAVLPHFGHLRPDQISRDDCLAYAAARRAKGRQDGTIWGELGALRNALSWAAKRGMIVRAPQIERPAKPAPRERWLTQAEIGRLLAADCAPHIRLAILLMLTTAARVQAVLDLTWDRVDLERGQINLRLPGATTRKGRAVVPINATLRAALQTARAAALSDHVIEWAGGPVASIRHGFALAVANAGLSDVTPHVLRHTAAVHMAEAGVGMDEIAQYLGHSDVRITASVYARFSPDHLRRAADVLDFGRLKAVR